VLEGLDAVDWAALEHAYGSAADVPELIRSLRSPDATIRKAAMWNLYGNVFHQGSRYEASAHAAAFLLELLADPATPDRLAVLRLLADLAIGYDENWLPGGFPVARYRVRAAGGASLLRAAPACAAAGQQAGARPRLEYWRSLSREHSARLLACVELAAYDAVRAGLPLFRALLSDDAPAMRALAAYTLGWFPEDASASVPPLTGLAADPGPSVAATALVAIGLLGTAAAAGAALSALTDPRDVVRWGAAIALARLCGTEADPRVARELRTWSSDASHRDDTISYMDGDLAGYAALALRHLGTAHGTQHPPLKGPPGRPSP
jgi:HEAT repeat protein